MPLNDERPTSTSSGEDQGSDVESSSERCDSMTSTSDLDCSRESFTSDCSSKHCTPSCEFAHLLLIYCLHLCVRDLFPCHFDFNSWFFFIPLFWPSLSNILAPSASPPKTLNLDEVMESARDLFNLRLAHEVVMNRNFHLEPESLPQDRYTMKKIGGLHLFTLWSFFVEYQWT